MNAVLARLPSMIALVATVVPVNDVSHRIWRSAPLLHTPFVLRTFPPRAGETLR